MSTSPSTPYPTPRRTFPWAMAGFVVLFLGPSLFGFGIKFGEFIRAFSKDQGGAFAIPPMLNYLLASLGFLCLLGWAGVRGTFHDLEGPKYEMLERERRLDREHGDPT